MTLYGIPGALYRIEVTSSLAPTNWIARTNILLPESPFLWVDTQAPVAGQRFYRSVRIE